MAYTTIDKPTDYFNTKLYAGNSTNDTAITGVGFQPDLVWLRNRSITENHQWQDAVRGTSGGKHFFIQSNQTAANQVQDDNDGVKTLDSDGFTLGYSNSTGWNQSGSNYVTWNWLAQNGTSANSNGSISSTVSVNTTAGFSISTWTSNSGGNYTIGHGLGATPNVIIVKQTSDTSPWFVYHDTVITASGSNKSQLRLNQTDGITTNSTATTFTSVSSTTFGLGTDTDMRNSEDMVGYCFAEIKGYSKFGKYTGNGSSDGTFVYTGFKPAWVMVKRTNSTGSWRMWDNKREGYNGDNAFMYANLSNAEESDGTVIELLSNGFKFRNSSGDNNANGSTYVYMAFAESPFVSSGGVPTTAR